MEVRPRRPRREGHAAHAELAFGIYPVQIDARRATGGQNHLTAAHPQQGMLLGIDAQQAAHAGFIREDAEGQDLFQHGHVPCADAFFEGLGHVAAGQRAHGGGPAANVMVSLVAHKLPHVIAGEGYAQLSQLQEAPGGACGLAQGDVAVHVLPLEGSGHVAHAVALIPGQG